ncbi:MAG: hypothetical protein WC876_06980 [Candidatus Thermoplasmatota archaeon]|jgi:hypothetical protein
MVSAAREPEWPDKAMFAAILLILAGAVGTAFRLLLPFMTVQDNLPQVFTDEIPGYALALCLATMAAGVLSLLRQAAVFAYLGAVFAIASLAMYGLVPFLGLLAIGAMVKSHLEGEETSDDGIQLPSNRWPDKAMAASLFMVVVGSIAVLQGILMFAGRFEPVVLTGMPVLAASIGVGVGLLGLVAAREVYHVRRPWIGWLALVLGFATLGFYLIGPVLAIVGMVLLALAHREDEFLLHAGGAAVAPTTPASANPAKRGRRRRRASA